MPDDPSDKHVSYGRARAAISLLILLTVFIAQYVLFKDYVLREVAPYYPMGYDQASYLKDAYRLFENIKANGYAELLRALVSTEGAQGKLFIVQTNAVFILLGPSRLAALLPNLLYFLALQAAVFYLVKKAFGGYTVPFIALGIVLMLAYPFYLGGRVFDFRMDFIAFSLYGIFVSAMVRSNAFLSNRWTIVAAILGFLLALLRHVALGYIGGVYLAMLASLSVVYIVSRDAHTRKDAARRARNVVLSAVAVLCAILPFLWASRAAIYDYYVVGHFLGKEKDIRSPGWDTAMTAGYYLRSIREHLGEEALLALKILSASAIVLAVCALLWKKSRARRTGMRLLEPINFVLIVISAAVPYLMLITDKNKNPVVAAVMIPPMILFCALALAWGGRKITTAVADSCFSGFVKVILSIAAAAIMALGMKNQYVHYKSAAAPERRAGLEGITRMVVDTGDYCEKNSITAPLISFDAVMDYLTEGSFTIVNYEARQRFLLFGMQLPAGIFDVSKEDAVARLRRSAVVLFSPDAIIDADYPFDKSIDAMRPELLSLIEKEFIRIKEYKIFNRTYHLFVRPTKKI